MTVTTKAAGYTFRGENYCVAAALHVYVEENPHPLVTNATITMLENTDGDIAAVLSDLARERGVDLTDESSYDSDDFPKPFTKQQTDSDPRDFCAHCFTRFSDGQHVHPFTVLGIQDADGSQTATHVIAGRVPEGCVAAAGEDDGLDRWSFVGVAVDQYEAIAFALSEESLSDQPPVTQRRYGTEVMIGRHKVTSWDAQHEDGRTIAAPAVKVAYEGVEVMVYASTTDGRIVVETNRVDDMDYRIVADDTDPVYVNYRTKSED